MQRGFGGFQGGVMVALWVKKILETEKEYCTRSKKEKIFQYSKKLNNGLMFIRNFVQKSNEFKTLSINLRKKTIGTNNRKPIAFDKIAVTPEIMTAIAQWQSVGLMIKRLLNPGSILELSVHRCVLGKNTSRLFPTRAKQSIRRGGQA